MTAGNTFESFAGTLSVESLSAAGHLKWTMYGPGKLGAFVAEMDYPVADVVADAVRTSADGSRFGYLPDDWVADMAAATSAFWGERLGWAPDPARVRPVADVLTAFTATVRHFTRPGSAIVLPTPAYMPFLTVPAMLGRELVQVPMARTARGACSTSTRSTARSPTARAAGADQPAQPHGPRLRRRRAAR